MNEFVSKTRAKEYFFSFVISQYNKIMELSEEEVIYVVGGAASKKKRM